MKHPLCIIVLLNLCFVSPLCGYHFLILGGDGGGSHYYAATSIGRELALNGHKVSVLVSDLFADDAMNRSNNLFQFYVYKAVVTVEIWQQLVAKISDVSLHGTDFKTAVQLGWLGDALIRDQCESILQDEPILKRLKEAKFDLVIGDLFYLCVGLVAQYLDTPFVTLSPHSIVSIQAQVNMSPINPAYIPDMITGLDTKMTFFDRVVSTLSVTMNYCLNSLMLAHYDQFKIKYNIKPEISTFKTLGQAELWFINTHFVFDFPRPLMPNVVAVGGLTTNPARPLDKVIHSYRQIKRRVQ